MSLHFSKTLFLARQCEQHLLTRCALIQTPSSLSCISTDIHQRHIPSQRVHHGQRPRYFSNATQRRASAPTFNKPTKAKEKEKEAPKSGMLEKMRTAIKQAEREGGLPEDVGYQPVFIPPTGRNLPSWSKDRSGRWMLAKKRFKDLITDVAAALNYRYYYMKPKPRMRLRSIPGVAEELHRRMYEAFAKGDLVPIERELFAGMMASLRGRIGQRMKGTQLKWTLHKYLSKSKLVSFRPIFYPGVKGEPKTERKGIVQAVVRIHTSQSLQHVRYRSRDRGGQMEILVDSQGRELASQDPKLAERQAKECVEYIVLQKVIRNSREGAWKVQSFAEETTLAKLEQEERGRGRAAGGRVAVGRREPAAETT